MPTTPEFDWQVKLTSDGVGGVAANSNYVVVGARDGTDTSDVFTCHNMSDGSEAWKIQYFAVGALDYGNSPRATPVIVDNTAVLLGAFGTLTVVELDSGKTLWQTNFVDQFGAEVPTWGFSGSPIVVDHDKKKLVVVQPGFEDASIVAFDLATGELEWQKKGKQPGYSSMITTNISGTSQLIGYDSESLGGWDMKGNRLWTMKPKSTGDFNVPTPLVVGDRLFVTTENNGSRIYDFDDAGKLTSQPTATFTDLAPDSHSPILVAGMICGVDGRLYCLDSKDLKPIHQIDEEGLGEYTSILSDGKSQVLVMTLDCQLLLFNVSKEEVKLQSRLRVSQNSESMSHPAIVGNRLIVRIGTGLHCLALQ